MAIQYGVLFRNAGLNGKATNLGATASLKIFSGAVPANCAAADPSGLLVTITLPATPFGTASGGAITLSGLWTNSASGTGTAASHRVYDSSGNCAIQGNVTTDLVLNNTSITTGQSVNGDGVHFNQRERLSVAMTNVVQSSFRIRTDATAAQGGTPVWAAAQNVNAVIASNTKFRIRFAISNLDTLDISLVLGIFASQNGGTYTDIRVGGVPAVSYVDATNGLSINGQVLTTSYLTGSGTYSTVGTYYGGPPGGVPGENILHSNYIELEFGLQFVGPACDGNTYSFRLRDVNSGTALTTYANTPTFLMANKGVLASTEGADSLAGVGLVPPAGRLSVIEMSDFVTGTGTVLWHVGILNETEAADVLTGSGVATPITAILARTEADDIITGRAFALPIGGVDGHVRATEANDAISGGVGTVTGVVGSLSPPEADDVLTGAAGVQILGALAVIENPDTLVTEVLLWTDQWVLDCGCAPSLWTPIYEPPETLPWPPVCPPSGGGGGGGGVEEMLQMEQLNVPHVNTLSNLSRTPDMNLLTITVDGRPFYPVGFSPDFSVAGSAVTWLNPDYSVVPGSTVIAAYSWTPPPGG